MADSTHADLDRYEADLARRHRRLVTYLKVRAGVGAVFLAAGAVALAIMFAVLAAAAGLVELPAVPPWAQTGYGGLMLAFIFALMALIPLRAGWTWVRNRRPEDVGAGGTVT